jgi:bis(5'-nucleosyl)-tetraphosphatase (symmetrical)
MTKVRTMHSDGELCEDFKDAPEQAPPGCTPWYDFAGRASQEATIVFGHWASQGLRLMDRVLALDSGCGWGGPLSAVRLDDRKVFQVERVD